MPVLNDAMIEGMSLRPGGAPPLVTPWNANQLQPASYDLLLGNGVRIPLDTTDKPFVIPGETSSDDRFGDLDMTRHFISKYPDRGATLDEFHPLPASGGSSGKVPGYWLAPGTFVLAHTAETISLPDYLTARVEGKSSLGRWGLLVHVTAGFVDPGFRGQVTLEICNLGPWYLLLQPGMRIAQVNFTNMTGAARKPYAGHYQNQVGAVGAALYDGTEPGLGLTKEAVAWAQEQEPRNYTPYPAPRPRDPEEVFVPTPGDP